MKLKMREREEKRNKRNKNCKSALTLSVGTHDTNFLSTVQMLENLLREQPATHNVLVVGGVSY